MNIKDKFENHLIIWALGLIIFSFSAGFVTAEKLAGFQISSVARDSSNSVSKEIAAQIKALTSQHNIRLSELQKKLLDNENQSTNENNHDSEQRKFIEAAERVRRSIEEENRSYQNSLELLIKSADTSR
ncbi:MAG: hypothetical protein PVF28_00090 [Thioalkalispiraceae bacterium]